jgi:hypothetical protein
MEPPGGTLTPFVPIAPVEAEFGCTGPSHKTLQYMVVTRNVRLSLFLNNTGLA